MIIQEGEDLSHSDLRIKELFKAYGTLHWNKTVDKIKKNQSSIDPSQILRLHAQAEKYSIDKTTSSYAWLDSIHKKYNTWIMKYTNNFYQRDLGKVCNAADIKNNYIIVQTLLQDYSQLNLNLGQIFEYINYLNNCMEWYFKAEKCSECFHSKKKITYDSAKELYDISKVLDLPDDFPFNSIIKELYENVSKLIEESLDFFKLAEENALNQEVKVDNDPSSDETIRFCLDPQNGTFRSIYYDKLGQKFSYSKAVQIQQKLAESPINFDKDIEVVKHHITKFDNWTKNARTFLQNYKLDDILISPNEFNQKTYFDNLNDIVTKLDILKIELNNIVLTDPGKDNILYSLEWALYGLLLINHHDLVDLIPSK